MREDVPLGGMQTVAVDLALRNRSDGDVEVVQLSKSAGLIMHLCADEGTVGSIAADFVRNPPAADDVPLWDACPAGIEIMRSQGLLGAGRNDKRVSSSRRRPTYRQLS